MRRRNKEDVLGGILLLTISRKHIRIHTLTHTYTHTLPHPRKPHAQTVQSITTNPTAQKKPPSPFLKPDQKNRRVHSPDIKPNFPLAFISREKYTPFFLFSLASTISPYQAMYARTFSICH